MSERPAEETRVHTRLLRSTLEVDNSRAYWSRTDGPHPVDARTAFESYWFGARSLARVELLLANLRARYDAFPPALAVLHAWGPMSTDARRVICHWHLQLADPFYRAFTGEHLVERRASHRPEVTRDRVIAWVTKQQPRRWSMSTCIQFASKLLSAAHSAGLVAATSDPRPLALPRVEDDALTYLLYLLREVRIAGTLLVNPYLASVGLEGPSLESRLAGLDSLSFRRQGDLVDFGWHHPTLPAWSEATRRHRALRLAGAAP